MIRTIAPVLFAVSLSVGANFSLAQDTHNDGKPVNSAPKQVVLPIGITEEMLTPPPAPRFMLEYPAKPLTLDEMMKQAREAERKAGVTRKLDGPESDAQGPNRSQ